MSASGSSIDGEFDTLRILLNAVAGGETPTRENAVVYANCRSALLGSEQGKMLPGFLYQCTTVDRFRDFIQLYDPDVDLRRQFIDRMIDRARPRPPQVLQPPRRSASVPGWDF